jgi:hypothetical protein
MDLTIVNNQLLNVLKKWEISAEKSCADHNIIKFDLRQDNYHKTEYSYTGRRYIVTDRNLKKFDSNLSRIVAMKFRTGEVDLRNLDRVLALQAEKEKEKERAVNLFQEDLILSCNKSFKKWNATKTTNHK